MKTAIFAIAAIGLAGLAHARQQQPQGAETHARTASRLHIVETSDVHANFFPYDFINQKAADGSLARVATFVDSLRRADGPESVVLLDNGDMLQGQPTAYYYDYIDTAAPHVASQMMNFLGYDAATVGNHDIETGHQVYDRYRGQNDFPMLAANVIDTLTRQPYFHPYAIIDRDSVRIAVIGLLTPAVPAWLPENLWSGLRFDDMRSTASAWVDSIRSREKADLIVGLFHSGRDSLKTTGSVVENASLQVARHVAGFDVVLMGHDHSPYIETIVNDRGDSVVVANPANNGRLVSVIDVDIERRPGQRQVVGAVKGRLVSVDTLRPDSAFMARFEPNRSAVEAFVGRPLGRFASALSTRDAYFGPSAFVDFIHSLQLAISGAEISFAAPLSFDAEIAAGEVTVADMFNLYKYENMLYTMRLTGREIKNYLEMSYDLWTNTVTSADDHLLRLRRSDGSSDMTHTGFVNPSYNFDSAAGIKYTVDITRPRGEKITIESMADGTPFDLDRTYDVAVNSYRGNGGGNLLTEGAGISADQLKSRVVNSTDKDLRFYLMRHISEHPDLSPRPLDHWRFVPEKMAAAAAARDRELLFPNDRDGAHM